MALLAPIQTYIDGLAAVSGYPADAVAACVARPDEAAPLLRALVQRAARGTKLTETEAQQLFLGLHILAKLRDTATFLPLTRLLRRPVEEVDDYLGDAATMSLSQGLASVFDGDVDALFDFITDATSDDALRDAAWHAAAFLTHQGAIPRESLRSLIIRFDDDRLAPPHDMAWYGWLDAIILLGFEDLAPRALPIWRDGRLDPDIITLAEFKVDLAAAVRAPQDRKRFEKAGCGYIDDIAEALAWVQWDRPADKSDDQGADLKEDFGYGRLPQPAVNPLRNVGRNDPCPCGSGKKAKKCCLATG